MWTTNRAGTTGMLRAALLLLVVLGVVGTSVVLAYERHWGGTWQLVPWVTLGGVSFGLAALLVRTTRATVWLARVVAALLGVWRHFGITTTPRHRWMPDTVTAGRRCRPERAYWMLPMVRLAMYPFPPLGHWCRLARRWQQRPSASTD